MMNGQGFYMYTPSVIISFGTKEVAEKSYEMQEVCHMYMLKNVLVYRLTQVMIFTSSEQLRYTRNA